MLFYGKLLIARKRALAVLHYFPLDLLVGPVKMMEQLQEPSHFFLLLPVVHACQHPTSRHHIYLPGASPKKAQSSQNWIYCLLIQ